MTRTSLSRLAGGLLLSAAWVSPVLADGFTDALKSAYETNPRIQAQRRALEQVNEQVSQALGAFRPSATASYQNGRQRLSFAGAPEQYGDVENRNLTVTQPIFTGGTEIFNYQAAKDRVRAAREQLKLSEQEVMLDAITAYLDVVRDERVHALSEGNYTVLMQQMKAAQDRFSVGDVTRTDVAQARSRAARAQAELIRSKGNLYSSLASFERVIGFRPENLPLSQPEALPVLPETASAAAEIALQQNPNLLYHRYNKDAAEDEADAAMGQLLPRLSLQGSLSREDGAGVTGGARFDQDRILLNVTIPIYQNGSEYSQVRAANSQVKQREFEAIDASHEVKEAVEQAWESMFTARSVITASETQVASAQAALEGVKQEHQYGSRTVLDVLDAEHELFLAHVGLEQSQRDYRVAAYNLMLVMGTLDVASLGITSPAYDPEEHYDSVKWQLIGF